MTTLDIAQLKDAMSRFTTGVTVVTTHHAGTDYGMTCNSFNTVSLDPPMVMWCIRKTRKVTKRLPKVLAMLSMSWQRSSKHWR